MLSAHRVHSLSLLTCVLPLEILIVLLATSAFCFLQLAMPARYVHSITITTIHLRAIMHLHIHIASPLHGAFECIGFPL